ncbi:MULTISPECIES: phosphotransferase family protein [unclassified Novosphingobium]|uniref:phosphotransferase family protein n=1 Tax=unclassified Novosphingobium TaxID=2644732 RepID=UPI00135BC839|nr:MULTISPECIES: phosphotransferase family protein [unclassified Novosphingobium]
MLIPNDKLLHATRREYRRMQPMLSQAGVQASAGVAIGHALNLLSTRSHGGLKALEAQARALTVALEQVRALVAESSEGRDRCDALLHDLEAPLPDTIEDAEADIRDVLSQFEECIHALLADRAITKKASLAQVLVRWEAGDLAGQLDAEEAGAETDLAVTRDILERYLRDRFDEQGLTVTSFAPLPGGFGKETILFAVSGEAFSGEFVMRRDPGGNDSLTNDCHEVFREYPVIKAAFERGFPAPDALWVDTEHALVPGGDFIVMRKSPGRLGGDIFGAAATVPARFADVLGDIAARLHTLEPLEELGTLSSFISPDLWHLPRSEAARRYIAGWYDYYRSEVHTPSPALCAIFSWLLDNVPRREGRAALLHGDFGFHNFLFEDDELSAVLDWEFAHIGDPAEELGYIAMATEGAMDWDRFMAAYRAGGGDDVDPQALRFYRVWAHVRNAAAGNILATRFSNGPVDDIKLTILPFHHFPRFISEAARLIAQAEAEKSPAVTAA